MNTASRTAIAAAFTALAALPSHAATITAWTFENLAAAVNNSPAPSTGVGTASSIGMDVYATPNIGVTTDDVLAGKSTDTGANGVADTSLVWRVRAQAGANGAANGWSSLAPIGTQGAVFAASTVGYSGITVSFNWYDTTQGEANLQLAYTTDGTTWINTPLTVTAGQGLTVLSNALSANTVMGSYVSDNVALSALAGQGWFTGLTASINDPLAANNTKFAVEIVNASTGVDNVSSQGTPLNNSSGNWRFDNVVIAGTVSAVPEPGSAALLALGSIAVFSSVRRRRRQG